jgi:hypothetical protein
MASLGEKRMRIKIILAAVFLLLAPLAARGQGNVTTVGAGNPKPFAGVPSGGCGPQDTAVNTATGDFYACNAGAWKLVSSTGGVTGSGAAGQAVLWNGTSAIAGSNAVLFADQFSGADMGAKVSACFAALPAGGGTCDARGFTGVQNAASTVALGVNQKLLLGAVDLKSTANPVFTLDDSASIAGLSPTSVNFNSTLVEANGAANCTGIKSANQAVAKSIWLSGFVLRGLGSCAFGSSIGVDMLGFYGSHLSDLYIYSFGTQISGNNPSSVTSYYNDYDHLTIDVGTSGTGVVFRGGMNAQRFFGARFKGAANNTGFIIGNTGDTINPNQVNCYGCTFEAFTGTGVGLDVERGSGIHFTGGRFENNNIGVQTAADSLAGPVAIEGAYFNSNTSDVSDQSGLLTLRPNGPNPLLPGQAQGISLSPGQNLLPDAGMEGWGGTTTLFGFSSYVSGTNWDNTGETTKETTIINSGSAAVKFGDGSATHGGVAVSLANKIPVDPSKPYTMTFMWTAPTTTSHIRFSIRLMDSASATITTGTVTGQFFTGTSGSSFGPATLTYSSTTGGHQLGADIVPLVANTYQKYSYTFKVPAGTSFIRILWWTNGGNLQAYLDDVYLAEGQATWRPQAAPLGDSANGGTSTVNGSLALSAHLNQITGGSDVAGTVTLVSGSKVVTFATAFASTPVCIVSDETTAGAARVSAKSASSFTISGGASDVVSYVCVGNPN